MAVVGFFLVFMIVPVVATALFSVSVRWDRSIWPEGLTGQWWVKVTSKSAFKSSLANSLFVSVGTVFLSLVLVAPTAYWVHTRLPRIKPLVELLAILPFGLPGVVLALGLIRLYSGVPLPIINTANILIASYVVITLPFMYRAVMNALEAIDTKTLSEAAQSLGANHWLIFIRVIMPNVSSGVVNGCLLVFSAAFAEFALANLLVGTRFKTFPMYLVEFTRFDARQASALAFMSFVFAWIISLSILWVVGWRGQPTRGAGQEKPT
ncbi:MAG: ABC transporter permease [Rhizobiaceae bacterium]|nr:ABC transporter permease [Rhizobiaceae bacterium]